MRKSGWFGVALLALIATDALASEVGLVTAVSGNIKLKDEKAAVSELKPFIKIREGDQVIMEGVARLQVVYFEGGHQETWLGSGALGVGSVSSKVIKGGLQSEIKTLPPILVKQLSKTPSSDGNVKTGMIRLRSIPSREKLEAVENEYAKMRQQADAGDRNPELYLLASYLEFREFDKLESLLKQLNEKTPGDPELTALNTLYTRAISEAKGK